MILLPYVLQLSVTLMNRLKGVCVGGGGALNFSRSSICWPAYQNKYWHIYAGYILQNIDLVLTKSADHWRSSHYAVTHMRNKNSKIQGRSPYVAKMILHAIRNYS